MDFIPKSERGNNYLAKQSGESAIQEVPPQALISIHLEETLSLEHCNIAIAS